MFSSFINEENIIVYCPRKLIDLSRMVINNNLSSLITTKIGKFNKRQKKDFYNYCTSFSHICQLVYEQKCYPIKNILRNIVWNLFDDSKVVEYDIIKKEKLLIEEFLWAGIDRHLALYLFCKTYKEILVNKKRYKRTKVYKRCFKFTKYFSCQTKRLFYFICVMTDFYLNTNSSIRVNERYVQNKSKELSIILKNKCLAIIDNLENESLLELMNLLNMLYFIKKTFHPRTQYGNLDVANETNDDNNDFYNFIINVYARECSFSFRMPQILISIISSNIATRYKFRFR